MMRLMSDAPETASFRAFVHGRVQGVGFRYFTVQTGQQLGLDGMARNLPDGTVEVHASGDRPTAEAFAKAIAKGPMLARVTRLDIDWNADLPEYNGFDVSY